MNKERRMLITAWRITLFAPWFVLACVVVIFASNMQRKEADVYQSKHAFGVQSVHVLEVTKNVADRVRSRMDENGNPEYIDLPETSLEIIHP